ncbi:MAG: hypothetical protein IKI54_06160 [Lachnospiraceae bacterium]|nr:hypothetical protein [Lachnospiraceae bacterium]
MIYLYVDPRYQMNYSWTERYSVLKQAARKRRTEIPEIQSLEEIPADDSKKAVLIRSASKHFISETVNKAINMEIPAIVLANIPADAGLLCSTIGSDLSTRALIAIRYLRSIGCGRTALFAVNPSTYSDEHCEKVFLHMGGKKEDVYYMSSGLNKALESLVSRIRDYDGIIATNSATAITLVKRIKEAGFTEENMPKIISFGRMRLTEYFRPSITRIIDDISDLGDLIFSVYDLIMKYDDIRVHIYHKPLLLPRQTTDYTPKGNSHMLQNIYPLIQNQYLSSPHIAEVSDIERLLQTSDENDIEIIRGMIQNESYDSIAERLYFTTNAVNYRIKKIKNCMGIQSTKQLKELLSQYFFF